MENKEYRHKKTGMIVVWGKSERYYYANGSTVYYLPKEVVEDSAEWEEIIIPVDDFFGKEIDTTKIHYFVVVDEKNISHALNDVKANNNALFPKMKKVAAFKEYEDACKFQRLYNSLRGEKELLITPSGNPTQYLKNLLKTL